MLASICEHLFNNFNSWKSNNLRILLPTSYYWRHRILWHFNPGMLQKQNMTLKNQVTLHKPVLLHLWRCNKLLLVIWIKFCLQEFVMSQQRICWCRAKSFCIITTYIFKKDNRSNFLFIFVFSKKKWKESDDQEVVSSKPGAGRILLIYLL